VRAPIARLFSTKLDALVGTSGCMSVTVGARPALIASSTSSGMTKATSMLFDWTSRRASSAEPTRCNLRSTD